MLARLAKVAKTLLIEFAWLLGSWAFSFLVVGELIGYGTLWNGPIDVQLHNTYFVLTTATAVLPFFVVVALLTTTIRAVSSRLQNRSTNAILVILGLAGLLFTALCLQWAEL